jgi:hypothetical protein
MGLRCSFEVAQGISLICWVMKSWNVVGCGDVLLWSFFVSATRRGAEQLGTMSTGVGLSLACRDQADTSRESTASQSFTIVVAIAARLPRQ